MRQTVDGWTEFPVLADAALLAILHQFEHQVAVVDGEDAVAFGVGLPGGAESFDLRG